MDKPNEQTESLNQETEAMAEQKKIAALEANNAALTIELQQAQERGRYLTADLDTMRRRAERDCQLRIDSAQGALIKDIISLVDDFERAFENLQTKPELMPYITGFELTYKSLLKLLQNHQATVIETKPGMTFNPEVHEAITQSDAPEMKSGDIVAVLQTGYRYKGAVLRPAKVSVKP